MVVHRPARLRRQRKRRRRGHACPTPSARWRGPGRGDAGAGLRAFRLVAATTAAGGWRTGWRWTIPARSSASPCSTSSPTRHLRRSTDQAFATAYYHWFFLIQPSPARAHDRRRPRMCTCAQDRRLGASAALAFIAGAMAEYERCFPTPPPSMRCARTTARRRRIDLEHDRADRAAGVKVSCPLMALWGGRATHGPTASTCWRHGATWRSTHAAMRSTADTTSRRSGRTNSPRHCWISWSDDAISPETERP